MPDNLPEKHGPGVYVFFGMIATGKTVLSEAWAAHKKLRCFNSDRVRKELAGIAPAARRREGVDAGIYTKDFSRKTYEALLGKAAAELQAGKSVVLDASYQHAVDRHEISTLAKGKGARVYFILCQCPEAEMKRRMELREQDASAVSDGRWEIYRKQKERFEPPDEIPAANLFIINTNGPAADLLEELKRKLP